MHFEVASQGLNRNTFGSGGKRILHVLPSAHCGGSELCAVETIRALHEEGYMNYVVVPREGKLLEKLAPYIQDYAIIENNWWLSAEKWSYWLKLVMIKGFLIQAFRIKKFALRHSIDIVLSYTIVIPSGALAAILGRISHLWYIHEFGDIDHQLNFNYGRRFTLWLIGNLSKKVIVNSETVFQHFKRFFPTSKLIRIYCEIDYPSFNPLLTVNKDAFAICMVGRIAPGKNQLVAIKALIHLKKWGLYPQITFVGGRCSSYFKKLTILIQDNSLGNQVLFIDHVPEPWKYIQSSDLVLVCSKNEAFGRVTVEAMKSGRPVIVANTGAGKELIIDKINGFLFNPDNSMELALVIKTIVESGYVGDITKAAYDFSHKNFNKARHKADVIQMLNYN